MSPRLLPPGQQGTPSYVPPGEAARIHRQNEARAHAVARIRDALTPESQTAATETLRTFLPEDRLWILVQAQNSRLRSARTSARRPFVFLANFVVCVLILSVRLAAESPADTAEMPTVEGSFVDIVDTIWFGWILVSFCGSVIGFLAKLYGRVFHGRNAIRRRAFPGTLGAFFSQQLQTAASESAAKPIPPERIPDALSAAVALAWHAPPGKTVDDDDVSTDAFEARLRHALIGLEPGAIDGDPSLRDALIETLGARRTLSLSPSLAAAAIFALGKCDSPAARKAIRRLRDDVAERVRAAVAESEASR